MPICWLSAGFCRLSAGTLKTGFCLYLRFLNAHFFTEAQAFDAASRDGLVF